MSCIFSDGRRAWSIEHPSLWDDVEGYRAFNRWKTKFDDYRQRKGTEPTAVLAERMVRTAFEAGFVGDVLRAKWTGLPKLASLAIKEGLNVGTMHPIYAASHPERIAIVDAERQLT